MRAPALLALTAACGLAGAACAQTPPAAGAGLGDILFDGRLRYESVSQDGLDSAAALTARIRLGWRSPPVADLRLLVEGEAVKAFVDRYNDTIHGPPGRTAVADPETAELNRLQLSWTGLPGVEATVGRQRIVLDDARFVGNVGFRQNEQTFDAARVTTTAFKPFDLTYAYVDRVHRVFGDDSPAGEWRSDSHLVHAEAPTPAGRLSLYGYWLDFADAPAQSSATMGARLAGRRAVAPAWTVTWAAAYARQTDHGANPARFALDYRLLSAGLVHGPLSVSVARERLDGDGMRGFQTPLATLHAFQGWADVFLTTPAAGLTEDSVAIGHSWPSPPLGRSLVVNGSWRTFSDAGGGRDYGRELDLSARLVLDERWAAEVKAARFDGAGAFGDRDKVWVAIEHRF